MTILLPSATVGAVLAVSRKTSSVIGLSGVNEICSCPCTVDRSSLTANFNVMCGRFGSGAAYVLGQSGPAPAEFGGDETGKVGGDVATDDGGGWVVRTEPEPLP